MLIKISDLLIQNSNGENPPIVTQKKSLSIQWMKRDCSMTPLRIIVI
jgi:hypothetical protein